MGPAHAFRKRGGLRSASRPDRSRISAEGCAAKFVERSIGVPGFCGR